MQSVQEPYAVLKKLEVVLHADKLLTVAVDFLFLALDT